MKLQRNLSSLLLAAAALSTLAIAGCNTDTGITDPGIINPIGIVGPTAANLSFTSFGGSQISTTAANGLLSVGTPNGATIVSVQSPTTLGGTITANADGSFTYNAPPTVGNDTFTFTLQNSGGNSTAQVTVNLVARGFFVKNDAPAGGNGTQAAPFQTLAQGVGAAAGVNGAHIVVFRGNGANYPDSVTVSANQVLRAFDSTTPPNLSGTVTVGSNCTLNALNFSNSPTAAVVANGVTGGTFSNLTITSPGSDGIAMTNPTGSLTIRNVNIANVGAGAAGQCFPLITSTSCNVTADNVTATNIIRSVFLGNITGGPIVQETIGNVVITGGNPIGLDFGNFDNCNVTVSATNIRQDAGRGGCSFDSFGAARTAALINNLNVTNCTAEGIFMTAADNSILKSRLQNSRVTGNGSEGLVARASANGQACLRLTNNTSEVYRFSQNNNSTIAVENFANLTTENIGNVTVPTGVVTSVAIGNCQIP